MKTLLLVEDEPITAMSEAAMLKRNGYNVIVAYSGEASIESISSQPSIDLVLMDIDLGPGMDGTDAASIILQKRNLPVVFLSSHTEREIVEKTEGVSSYGYIVKNSGETVLIASIKMAFRLYAAQMEIERQKMEIEASNEELQSTNEELNATNEELVRSQNDILERDQALSRSVHMLEESQKIAHLGHWELDHIKKRLYWSDEIYRIFNIKPQDFRATYEAFLSYVHPDERDFVNSAYESSVKSRQPYDIIHRILLSDGSVKYVNEKCLTTYDEKGKPMSSFGTVLDITERKIAELERQKALDELRISEERFSKLFIKNPVCMLLTRVRDTAIVDINESYEEFFHVSRKERIGKISSDLGALDQADLEKMMVFFRNKKVIHNYETRLHSISGEIKDVLLSVNFFDIDGEMCTLTVINDITGQKDAERALRKSEERLRAIFDMSMSGIVLLDVNGCIEYANNRLADMFRMQMSDLTGSKYSELVHPSERAVTENHLSKLVSGEENDSHTERRYVRADGTEFRGYISSKRLTQDEKGPSSLVGIITDLTELRLAEKKLTESTLQFQMVVESSPDAIFIQSRGSFVYLNPAAVRLFGAESRDMLIGKTILDRFHQESHDVIRDRIRTLNEEKKPVEPIHEKIIRLDGRVVDVEVSAAPFYFDGSDGALVFVRDISSRIAAERIVNESTLLFQQVVESSPDAVFIHTMGKYVYLNSAALRLFGAESPDELIGKPVIDQVHPDSRDEVVKRLSEIAKNKPDLNLVRVKTMGLDGVVHCVEANAVPFVFNGNDSVLVFLRDINGRIQTEAKLKESEQKHKLVASLITDYVFKIKVDKNGSLSIVDVSENFTLVTGKNLESLSKMDIWMKTVNPEDLTVVKEKIHEVLTTGGPVNFECRTFVKDGKSRWVQIFAKGERVSPGERIHEIVGAVRDVTARKKAEEELRKTVEQKETLMKELQHRVKNNLTMISSLFMLESDRASSEETRTVLGNLRDRVSSLENLYSLLNWSGGVNRLRMDEYIASIVESIKRTYSPQDSGISIEIDCDQVEISVKSAASLGLAVNELVMNALKHAFPGSKKGAVNVMLKRINGSCELIIRDDGPGLPEGFDISRSSGFGLRLASMLATQMGGRFEVGRQGGASFTIVFTPD